MPRVELRPGYSIARLVNGGWQLSEGHRPGPVDRGAALDALHRLVDAGLTTFDCADIYTGVEELYGELLRGSGRREEIQVHTKCVPDRAALASLDRRHVAALVERSLRRLGVERLDLVQLHWWDFEVPGWLDAAGWLTELVDAGKIRHLGVTNFDVERLRALLDAGVDVVAHQLQVSLLDRRAEHGMARLCAEHGVHLLAYGSLAGGFLTGRWLGRGAPDEPLANRSLVKYRLVVDEFGGWPLFRQLLTAVDAVARRHGVSAANVAVRWALDRPAVAAAIVGVRDTRHLDDNLRLFGLELDDDDLRRLDAVLARARGPRGDVYHLERIPGGRHAAIMKTDLNRLDAG